MKRILLPLLLILFILTGCAQKLDGDGMIGKTTYIQIDQEKAKEMMAVNDGHVIVDVRRADEYAAGHIPGAILIPNESIGTEKLIRSLNSLPVVISLTKLLFMLYLPEVI